MLQLKSFGNIFTNIFGSTQKSSAVGGNHRGDATVTSMNVLPPNRSIVSNNGLKFHLAHGKAIKLSDDTTVAKRNEDNFEHSTAFSHRPINVDEMVAIEIVETTEAFHGPMSFGFTSVNPSVFLCNEAVVPLGRDLKNMAGFWVKSVHMFPVHMCAGTVLYFKLNPNGLVLHAINGKQEGLFIKDVDTTRPLWAVLEAYGMVQSVKFVDKTMNLSMEGIALDENANPSLPSPSTNASTTPRRSTRSRRNINEQAELPLLARRNVRLSPIQKSTRQSVVSHESSSNSPVKEQLYSPGLFDKPNGRGMCIICVEKERDTAFTKCGHLCMCFDCAKAFKRHQKSQGPRSSVVRRNSVLCPICRAPVTSILRIYC